MPCIKTGAVVKVLEYGRVAAADIHRVGDTVVVKFAGHFEESAWWQDTPGRRPVTHDLILGIDHYWDKKNGIAVVPASQLMEV